MGIITPAYFFPSDDNDPRHYGVGPYWSRLIDAAKKLSNQLIVIANPGNGSGIGPDSPNRWQYDQYTKAINQVRQAGGLVIGYVYTSYALRLPNNAVQDDIDNWYTWYEVDGIFLDEVSNTSIKLQFYQDLHTYIRGKDPKALVVMNPGELPDPSYFSIDSIICVSENQSAVFDANHDFSTLSQSQKEKSCVLIHTLLNGDWNTRFDIVKNAGIEWCYITDDIFYQAPDNPWDTLPPFFEAMVCALFGCALDGFKKPSFTQEVTCGTWETPTGKPALHYPMKITGGFLTATKICWIDYHTDISSNLLSNTGNPLNIQRRTELVCRYNNPFRKAPTATLDYLNCSGGDCDLLLKSDTLMRMLRLTIRYELPAGQFFHFVGFKGIRVKVKENNNAINLTLKIYNSANNLILQEPKTINNNASPQDVDFLFNNATKSDPIKAIIIIILDQIRGANFVFDRIELF